MPLVKAGETPRAAFGTNEKLLGSSDREVPRILSDYLRGRFSGFWAKKVPWLPWVFNMDSDQGAVSIGLRRSKIKNGWRLTVVGRRFLPPRIRAVNRQPRYDPAVLEVCRALHTLLSQTPGIVNLRWYFQGTVSQSRAVRTPDELPWHESSGG